MKEYNQPEINFISFNIEDGIMASPSPSPSGVVVSYANSVTDPDVGKSYYTEYEGDNNDWTWNDMP